MPNEKKNNKKKKEEQPSNIFEKEEKKEHFFLDFMKRINSEEKKKEVDNTNEKQLKLSFNIQLYGSKLINWLNEQLDSVLNTNKRIKWFSLVLAIGIYLVVNGGINISNSNYYEILKDVPVQIVGENDLYEVLSVPDTVVINTYGNLIDVQSTKLKNNYYAYIDVSNLAEGNHAVLIQAGNIPSDLGYDIKPESVEITIAKKVVQTFDLGYEFINEQTDSIYTVHDPVRSEEHT